MDPNYCLPHHIYVPSPSGSVSEKSVGGFVWGPAGFGSIDGYVCIENYNDPVFSNPPPKNACPPESTIGFDSNQLQYSCYANEMNQPINVNCVDGYSKVIDSFYTYGNGNKKYYFTCGLGGYIPPWDNEDQFAPCGQSGAKVIVVGSDHYSCAYTE